MTFNEESVAPVLSVTPRVPKEDARRLICIDGERVLLERTGEIHCASLLPMILLREPPAILVCEDAASILSHLNHTLCSEVAGWNYKLSDLRRTIYRQHNRKRPTTTHHLMVSYLGWKPDNRTKGHFHYPIDPMTLTGHPLYRLVPYEYPNDDPDSSPDKLLALLKWGLDMRSWCQENGIRVSSSAGALAVQLLRDPRFYPEKRRKVPKATNEKARAHLPGNHYRLFTNTHVFHEAYYLDMRSAHHYCASKIKLPCANGLLARGRFDEPIESLTAGVECVPFAKKPVPPWMHIHHPDCQKLLNSHGLLQVQLESLRPHEKFTLPYLETGGTKLAWIYTNELPLIAELGGNIRGIEAAWTSWQADKGIPKYAEWAMNESQTMSPERRLWVKPVLLAAYGMLAARPKTRESLFGHSDKGEPNIYPTAHGPMLPVSVCRQSKETETRVANVIQRGMIEAEVRVRVIRMAREMESNGFEVLAIYADAVIINANQPMPLILPEPWDYKTELTKLEFLNRVSFHSDQMTKLPGIPDKTDHLRVSQYKQAAAQGRGDDYVRTRTRNHIRGIRS